MTADLYAWADHRIFEAAAAPDGKALLFGADQASLFALDAATRDVLSRWRSRDAIELRDVPHADREVLEALRDAQVLIPSARLRIARRRSRSTPPTIPLATLVLEVAQACNLRCSYCYAGGGSYGGDAAAHAPRARAARRAPSGGVLRRPRAGHARPVRRRAAAEPPGTRGRGDRRRRPRRAQRARSSSSRSPPTARGSRPRRSTSCAEHRIGVSVSIDGPPDVHDANRRYAAQERRRHLRRCRGGREARCARTGAGRPRRA